MSYTKWKREYLNTTHEINVSELTPLQKENAKRNNAGLSPLTKQEFEQRIELINQKQKP